LTTGRYRSPLFSGLGALCRPGFPQRKIMEVSMNRLPLVMVLLLLPLFACCEPVGPQSLPPVEVSFSPKGGCTEAVVKEIDAAQKTILVQAYSFTSVPIAKALVDAHQRGVDARVILDKSQRTEKYSSADFVLHAGIPVWIDDQHAIAHNKVMVIDGAVVVTGSFNFTKAAEESNAENLLVIRSPELAARYTANWTAHLRHSEPYAVKEVGYSEKAPPTERQRAPIAKGYVSSKNSAVFHRPECDSAAKISAKNLVRYATRTEALVAGKKPCEECAP
jgi:phosphatidylserine/phosphatidylglycerophosphate/cardiolipin synthase-like enzyme